MSNPIETAAQTLIYEVGMDSDDSPDISAYVVFASIDPAKLARAIARSKDSRAHWNDWHPLSQEEFYETANGVIAYLTRKDSK